MIEMLIAMAIFTSSITGLIVVTSSGIANVNFAKNKLTATYLAQEGIEVIRNLRDRFYSLDNSSDWNFFIDTVLVNIGCLIPDNQYGCQIGNVQNDIITPCGSDNCIGYPLQYDPNTGFYTSTTPGTGLRFFRTIKVESMGADEIRVTSEVVWNQGLRTRRVSATENLFGWR